MSYIINKDEREPAMLYEAIACYAFNCSRLNDPEQITDASFFDFNFVPPLTADGLQAMYTIIDHLIAKTNDRSKISEYYGVRNSLDIGMDQDNSIALLGWLAYLINE